VDTEKTAFESWQDVFRSHGARLDFSDWARDIGTAGQFDPIADLERQTGRKFDATETRAKARQLEDQKNALMELLPGVVERLDEAVALGLRVGLASSASERWVLGHLAARGIAGRFHAVKTRNQVPRLKPAPDLFLAVAGALGVAASECVALEDSPNGIASARAAGMFCVAVPNEITRTLDLSGADMQVPSLARLSLAEVARRMDGKGGPA